MTTFTAQTLPDLTGTTVVITGASSGLGRAAARLLAARGARVLAAVRDLDKARRALADAAGEVELRRLDLADLASVRAFADGIEEPVDLLLNNAGLMVPPFGRTADGFEMQIGTNHLGHFALTNLLLPRVRGRVVTVSSLAHRVGRIDLEDLTLLRRPYRPLAAYGQSKLANLLFAAELQRRLAAVGSPVLSMAAHPGVAATDLTARNPGRGRLDRAVEPVVLRLVGHDAVGGALPMLQAALADLPGGSYVGPQGLLGTRGAPGPAGRSRRAQDVEMARRLWEVSAELTGADFPLVRDPLTR